MTGRGELARRIAFGVIAAPIAIAIVFAGGAALAALLAIAAALAAWEFFRLARASGLAPFDTLGVVAAGILPLIVHARYLHLYDPERSIGGLSLTALSVLVLLAIAIWRRGAAGRPLSSVAATVLGVAYTSGMLSFAYAIRYHEYAFADASLSSMGSVLSFIVLPAGGLLLVLPVLLTWATDIGAYVVGRSVGRHKLIVSISPGKTVEGAVGGLAVSIVAAWAFARWVLQPATHLDFAAAPWGVLLFGAAVSIAAQIGDLVESLFKREANVKDSSHLIPGHGGVLDRIDSLLFVLPVAYILLGSTLRWAP